MRKEVRMTEEGKERVRKEGREEKEDGRKGEGGEWGKRKENEE